MKNQSVHNLTEDDEKVLKEIRDAKDVFRGKDSTGIPFLQHVFRLHKLIYGEVCSNCPNKLQGYINNIKKFNPLKQEIMSDQKKEFELKNGVVLPIAGTSQAYSNANITDEIALELLAANPNRKILFSKLPKNVNQLIEEQQNKAPEKKSDEKSELVKIGDYSLTIEETLKVLELAKVTTKASSVTGLQKAFAGLKDEPKNEVLELAKSLVEGKSIVVNTEATGTVTEAVVKTLEEIQFDLEKAEQDLEDLKANAPENDVAIKTAEDNIEALKVQVGNLSK